MEENTNVVAQKNPLSNWYRQPKIYISLPSKGKFYPPGALDISENGQYPVYAMTAKDELMLRTPDALLSGQSTVEVIKSCVPAIKDPWTMPSIDLDFCLIAIRIATYGDKMDVGAKCPHCDNDNTYEVDLGNWLGVFNNFEYVDQIDIDPLSVKIRPYTYREMTKMSLKALEQQKIFSIVNDESMSDEEKIEKFSKSYVKLTEMSVGLITECIHSIHTPDGIVTDKTMIKDFIDNCNKEIFDKINNHLIDIKERIELKDMEVACGDCKEKFAMPITLDQANFFAVRSQG